MVRRDPRQLGQARTRWTLESVRAACPWLRLSTTGGMSRLLRRLGIHLKAARDYVHSPDPQYEAKLADVQAAIARAKADPQRYVVVFMDEVTYERQPSVACTYEAAGSVQPLARRSHRSNAQRRVLGALNALTGQVTYIQRAHADISALRAFYKTLRAAYPQAETIYVVQDNWPMHFHPDVLTALQAQSWPYAVPKPPHWRAEPTRPLPQLTLPIRIVQLPTYASWCNPIEKLWRKLRQEVLHLHRWADDWPGLQDLVSAFLDAFVHGSEPLRRYTGLLRY